MFDDGLDGFDDGNDNFFDEINNNDDYHEINHSDDDGLDGEDDGNDNYYDDIQSEGSLHSSALPSSSTTPKQSKSSIQWGNMTQAEKKHSLNENSKKKLTR